MLVSVGQSWDYTLIVVFLLAVILPFDDGFVDFEPRIPPYDSTVLSFGGERAGLGDHFVHFGIDELVVLEVIESGRTVLIGELVFFDYLIIFIIAESNQLVQLLSVFFD